MSETADSVLAQHFRQAKRHLRSLLWKIWGGGFLLVTLGFAIAWFFIQPAPPKTIVMVTGSEDGAYHEFGKMYAEFLREQGITLELRSTPGTVTNYEKLMTEDDVDLAIVQSGAAPADEMATGLIESLASLYFEPVWVFYRSDLAITDLRDLQGRSIAIGFEGSGTAAIARLLLAENGVQESDETPFILSGGHQAMSQLVDGDVGGAIFVMSPRAGLIRELVTSSAIRLLSFERHQAYARRYPYLTSVTLRRGVIDLSRDIPRTDVKLVAPAANLVAKQSLHDSLIPLLLRAAEEIHRPRSSLFDPGRLPSTEFVEFPLNPSAQRYFEEGPPFLQKFLPFWVASAVDRGKILLLPAITLLFPLLRIAPPLYRWSIRKRIFQWYRILRKIELDLRQGVRPSLMEKHARALTEMEDELDELRSVPLSYMEEFYNLRLHMEFVERRVQRALKESSGEVGQQAVPNESERGSVG